jgi:hypothetical protein
MKVVLGFSRNKKPFSLLIQLFTSSKLAHTYLRLDFPKYQKSIIYHAQSLHVHCLNANDFYLKNEIVAEFEVEVGVSAYRNGTNFYLENVGKPYSIFQCVGLLWVLLGRRFGKKWSNPFSNGGRGMICSELNAMFLGMPLAEDVTPSDVYDYILTNKLGRRVV